MSRLDPANARSRRTAEALLAAARALLEESGAGRLTMAAVADRAGVSRRAVYLHFASRHDLVGALFDYVNEIEGLDSAFAEVLAHPDAEETLRAYGAFLARQVPRILAVSKAIERDATTDSAAAEHWARAMRYRQDMARQLVTRLSGQGILAPTWTAETAEQVLLALGSIEVVTQLTVGSGWPTEQAARRFGDLLCLALVSRTE